MSQTYDADGLVAFAAQIDGMAGDIPIELASDRTEALQLTNLAQSLGGAASNLRLIAIREILAETDEPLAMVVGATDDAHKAIKTIKTVSTVISIVGDVVVLVQAVSMRKWSLVTPALKSLQQALPKPAARAARDGPPAKPRAARGAAVRQRRPSTKSAKRAD